MENRMALAAQAGELLHEEPWYVSAFSNISSLITRIAAGNVLFALALPAVCCSIAGGWLGAKLALTRGAKLIRVVMLCVLVLLTVRLAVEWLA